MKSLSNTRIKITDMAKLALDMWQKTNEAFMKHDLDLLSVVLDEENKLNNLEKEIVSELVELGRASSDKKEKTSVLIFTEVVGDLELIGDYCKDILERVQIKIEEKLLFSDEAVKEYEDLYHKAETALTEIVFVLEGENLRLTRGVSKNKKQFDALVNKYRARHNERLMGGLCIPIACNMFLNMLDFVAAVYAHTNRIAVNLSKIK